jgi:microcystin-dependent protein
VGAVFIAVVSTNPATLLGYGTWSAFAAGRMLIGVDAGQTEFDTVEETGGAKTHTLTEAQMPSHTHTQMRLPTATGGSVGFTVDTSMSGTPATTSVGTAATGGGQAFSILNPYITCFMWKRTA